MPDALSVDIHAVRGDFHLRVAHDFQPGRITAVIGPNGAGKSTLLQALAGLLPVKGTIRLGERILDDPSGKSVASHRREVGLLAQEPLLFPHLSVLDNIAFGPKSRGVATAEGRQIAQEWAERLNVGALLSLRPDQLSGGQRGRAALARALAAAPQVLLLDEPSAALDVDSAMHFRKVLTEQLRDMDLTVILVSHTAEDIVALADTLMVLEDGVVTDCGPALDRLTRPRRDFTARLLGINRISGVIRGDTIDCDGLALQGLSGSDSGSDSDDGRDGWAAIEPHLVKLSDVSGGLNSWETTAISIDARGGGFAISLAQPQGLVAHLGLTEFKRQGLRVGDPVRVQVDPSDLRIYRSKAQRQ